MYGVKSWPQLKSFHYGTYNGDYTGAQTAGRLSLVRPDNARPLMAYLAFWFNKLGRK